MAPETELVTKVRALLNRRHGGEGREHLRLAFEDYDKNESGSLEAEELSLFLADAGVGNKFTRSFWVKGIIARLATDEDGLSWDDLAAALAA